ncbi:MAG: hypothetical protein ABSA46_09900 [Thermodesulfovibrionales bacterium]|jgi:hypothetical protein
MERRKRDKGFIVSARDVNSMLESYKPNETVRIALGFEVEGTLSVRGPDVSNVVSKSPHEVRGSLKRWPGHQVRLPSFNSKPKAYGYFGICVAFESMYISSIEKMETYGFSDQYRFCPDLATYVSGKGMKPAISHEDDKSLVRRV